MITINDEELVSNLDGSCEYLYLGRPFTGLARAYTREKALVSEIEYVNGMQEGLARTWYPSGQLKSEDHFRKNGRTGLSREWHPDGKPKRETLFDHSIRLQEKVWDEQGTLIQEKTLSEDAPLFKTLQDFLRLDKNEGP